ncbi:hypothetical protein OUZ56_016210 [Daphnia magna]|uniref:Uncharacterized protein n=1 Tax=Daphnia magna TaxID=35525 RepID=A0ABR0AQ08_9CRUS|nr:hypothetical protein OUZ56_016210 [Daphnia magna]
MSLDYTVEIVSRTETQNDDNSLSGSSIDENADDTLVLPNRRPCTLAHTQSTLNKQPRSFEVPKDYKLPTCFSPIVDNKLSNKAALNDIEYNLICREVGRSLKPYGKHPQVYQLVAVSRSVFQKWPSMARFKGGIEEEFQVRGRPKSTKTNLKYPRNCGTTFLKDIPDDVVLHEVNRKKLIELHLYRLENATNEDIATVDADGTNKSRS